MHQLEVLAEEVAGCTRCRLSETRTRTVFARGSAAAQLVLVGEGPGENEDREGVPFIGKAGKLLDSMVIAAGLSLDEIYIVNAVKCRPPKNRKPEPDEIEACRPYLVEQLSVLRPRVIIALGATAVQALLGGRPEGITRMRGAWKLYGETPVMPTYHPAYLLREPRKKQESQTDLDAAVARLKRGPA
jgi:uracil-DNA glycosylase